MKIGNPPKIRLMSVFLSCTTIVGAGVLPLSAQTSTPAVFAFQRSQATDADALCRGLDQGGLIESLVYRRIERLKNPLEDSIIVRLPSSASLDAAVVFTREGKVFSRHATWGVQPLPKHLPDDLRNGLLPISKSVRALNATRPASAAPSRTIAAQLDHAFALLHDHGDFPVSRASQPISVANADGTTIQYPAGSIVFDWENASYFYHPALGIRLQAHPRDPLTDEPFLAVKNGDTVECIAFYYQYQKKYPNEKVNLIAPVPSVPKSGEKLNASERHIWAAVAYTREGKVLLRSPLLGDVGLDAIKPEDINKTNLFVKVYKDLLDTKQAERTRRLRPDVKAPAQTPPASLAKKPTPPASSGPKSYAEIRNTIGRQLPSSLPGDDDDRQMRRVHLTLKNLDANTTTLWETFQKPDGTRGDFLMIFCDDRAFQYQPQSPTVHRRYRDAFSPSNLIAGLLFSQSYLMSNPGEKVDFLPPPVPDSTQITTLFTKAGATYLFHPSAGELPLPGVAPADWQNPARQPAIFAQCKTLLEENRRTQRAERERTTDAAKIAREFDNDREYIVERVERNLARLDLKPRRINQIDRSETGELREYPVPTLVFEWRGATYTYNFHRGCVRADGTFPARVRIK